MTDVKTFGRRAPGSLPRRPPPQVRPSERRPSLKDIGFTPRDDGEELLAFRQDYRKRRFKGRGGWRWVSGVCVLASTVSGLLGLGAVSGALGAAGLLALGFSFLPDRAP